MQESMSLFESQKKEELGDELAKLFRMQDRKLDDDTKLKLVDGLIDSRLPFDVLVQGIRCLLTEDLKQIKLAYILQSARTCLERERVIQMPRAADCENCFGNGRVFMRDERNYEVMAACNCTAGYELKRRENCFQWDGSAEQFNRNRKLIKK